MSKIIHLLSSLDDMAWEALASKGLLRRAQKEVSKGIPLKVESDTPFLLTLQLGELTMTIPADGPTKATCTCGATGCCHHLIAAGLFFRTNRPAQGADSSSENPDDPTTSEETTQEKLLEPLLVIDYSVLKRWCGASVWRTALKLLGTGITLEVTVQSSTLVAQLKPTEAVCRFLADTGLDGVIVTGAGNYDAKALIGAAVVLLKAMHGQNLPEVELIDTAPVEALGAPRTRADILESTRLLLEQAIGSGLAHGGTTTTERFTTLAVSAEGNNLPRFARALKTIADEFSLVVNRHGSSDTERLLDAMAHVYALGSALENGLPNPAPFLIGQHRSGYVDVPMIELNVITAYPWQSRSGFRGITVLFWHAAEKRWLTWSDSRNKTSDPSFDPLLRFDEQTPWSDSTTVRDLLSKEIKLTKARRNSAGRLSSSQACQVAIKGANPNETLNFGDCLFTSWEKLQRHVVTTRAVGLREFDSNADWVVLSPTQWGEMRFDPVEQRLRWRVVDDGGRKIALQLSYSELTREAIDRLEAREPPKSGQFVVIGKVIRSGNEMVIEPLALLPTKTNLAPVHTLLPERVHGAKPSKKPLPHSAHSYLEDDELSDEASEFSSSSPMSDRWLKQVRTHLIARAEAGVTQQKPTNSEAATSLSRGLHDSGLTALAHAVSKTIQLTPELPKEILQATFLCRLHEQASA